jgi:hypothetical protein
MKAAADVNPIDFFGGADTLLKYGPLGLAGLMLVLVIIALLIGGLDARRESLLKQFLYIGALCFVVALIAPLLAPLVPKPPDPTVGHTLHLSIFPQGLSNSKKLPAPIVKVNNEPLKEPLDYVVTREVSVIIDVSNAVDFAGDYRSVYDQQVEGLNAIADRINPIIVQLNGVAPLIEKSCPGGASGIDPIHAKDILAIVSSLSSALGEVRTALSAVPPKVQN